MCQDVCRIAQVASYRLPEDRANFGATTRAAEFNAARARRMARTSYEVDEVPLMVSI